MADHVEITTAHNIVIKYELADVLTRLGANVIDLLIMGLCGGLLSAVFGSIMTLQIVLVMLPIAFYHLFFEWWNDGQSPGKKLFKVKVVSLKDQAPSIEDLIMRWIFRLIDVTFTIGTLSIVTILSTEKNQRIGDVMAGTAVIKLNVNQRISLQDFDNMEAIDHEVSYPGVARYTDKDILIVKDTLNQYRNHPNLATKKVMFSLAEKIATDLEVKVKKSEVSDFLKQVMNDYIILTR